MSPPLHKQTRTMASKDPRTLGSRPGPADCGRKVWLPTEPKARREAVLPEDRDVPVAPWGSKVTVRLSMLLRKAPRCEGIIRKTNEYRVKLFSVARNYVNSKKSFRRPGCRCEPCRHIGAGCWVTLQRVERRVRNEHYGRRTTRVWCMVRG